MLTELNCDSAKAELSRSKLLGLRASAFGYLAKPFRLSYCDASNCFFRYDGKSALANASKFNIHCSEAEAFLKKEFLIIIPDNDSFCSSKKSFIDFLKVDAQLSIAGSKINYRKSPKARDLVSARFHVDTDQVKSKNERYFLMTIECQQAEMVDDFSEMCERIKSVAERISPGKTAINTLWDDIGRLYAEKAYPIINEVENSMRRLIAKFMLINVGMNWSKDAITPELFNKIENFEDEQVNSNDLHKLDFIHLKQVLFDKKRDINLEDLDRLLAKTKFSEEDKDKILKYIPKSNWEKYFSSLLDEKDSSIEKKWELLYKLRNKVAHNRNVKKEEFNQILGLSSDIKDIILKATTKLGEIDLNEEDRGLIIHSYPHNLAHQNYLYGEKAVIQYYLDAGYRITMSQRSGNYDFVALNSDGEHGVEVKVCSSRNARRALLSAAKQVEYSLNKTNIDLISAHIVIALTNDISSAEIEQLAESISIVRSKLSGKINVQLGILDNVEADATFTPLILQPDSDPHSKNP